MTGLVAAVSFLTVLPGNILPGQKGISYSSLVWFPVVGIAIGLILGAIWYGTHLIWPPGVAAAIVVGADLVLTGMLHMDGLVDSADGLLPPLPKERRLEVMSDPHAGAFGMIAVLAVLMIRFSTLMELAPSVLLLGGLWAMSRGYAATVVNLLPYARETGIASLFNRHDHTVVEAAHLDLRHMGIKIIPAVIGLCIALLTIMYWHPIAGLAVIITSSAVFSGVMLFGWSRIDGFTGDVIGAAIVLSETAGLLIATIR